MCPTYTAHSWPGENRRKGDYPARTVEEVEASGTSVVSTQQHLDLKGHSFCRGCCGCCLFLLWCRQVTVAGCACVGGNEWLVWNVLQNFVPPSFDDKILEVVAVFGGMQIAVSRLIDIQHHRIAQVGTLHTHT